MHRGQKYSTCIVRIFYMCHQYTGSETLIRRSTVCAYLSPASASAKRVASAEYSSTLSRSMRKFPFDFACGIGRIDRIEGVSVCSIDIEVGEGSYHVASFLILYCLSQSYISLPLYVHLPFTAYLPLSDIHTLSPSIWFILPLHIRFRSLLYDFSFKCRRSFLLILLETYHLLCVHHDVSIAVDSFRPHLWSVLPDLHMVVQTHSEMVRNEIFSRYSQVKRVPVLEFLWRQ